MAEARNGADSNPPAVEMEAVSMNCRRVEWNKMASFRKPAASRLLLDGLARRPERRTVASPSKVCAMPLRPLPKRRHVPPISHGLTSV